MGESLTRQSGVLEVGDLKPNDYDAVDILN
jgi:hypothetical protein